MYLRSLSLTNFRLHKNTNIEFSEGLNYIVGGNGQGKTTILEAIHYISTTKSFLAQSDVESLTFNESVFEVKGKISDLIDDTMIIRFDLNENKKHYAINGKQINTPSEIVGRYPIVLLSPRDSKITEESPADRRKFVDSIISQFSHSYFQNLLEYKRILRQRSSLLLQLRENFSLQMHPFGKSLGDELNVWTEKLIEYGSKLIIARTDFINEFKNYVSRAYNLIMSDIEIPDIEYVSLAFDNRENVEEVFRELLQKESTNELRRAVNLVGPHRDEYRFLLNGTDLRTYGSQGQHKTFQVALRFAEYFYLRDKMNKNPFFLLDDVFGDLDKSRGKMISEHLSDLGQAFITLTDFTNFGEIKRTARDSLMTVTNGEVGYVN